jgi:hypothetical protein
VQEERWLQLALEKGQEPSLISLGKARATEVEVTYNNMKYVLNAKRLATDIVTITLGGKVVTSRLREQSDGTLLATFLGATHRLTAQVCHTVTLV